MERLLTTLAGLAALATPATAQEMRTVTDSLDRRVEIPADPQRIVALHDTSLTLPLVELGKPPVGSLGRTDADGDIYLRAVNTVLGVDFGNSDIGFIGTWGQIDYEAVAALDPDLILALADCQDEMIDQLEQITATVTVPCRPEDALAKIETIADYAGLSDAFDARMERFEDQIARAKRLIPDAAAISVSKVQVYDGELRTFADYGAFTTVLDRIGFARPEFIADKRAEGEQGRFVVSPEILHQLDADFLFDTYRIDQDDSPAQMRARIAGVLPGWCQLLHACRERQYVGLPREHASPQSFTTLGYNVNYVINAVAGRDFVPFGE